MPIPKVLLFDLGGVLVDFVGIREVAKLTPQPLDPAQMRQRWVTSQAMVEFETGACSADEFARSFIEELSLDIDPDQFLILFTSWLRQPYPGTLELLAGLRDRFTLACLSNTNEVHWPLLLDRNNLRTALDRHFASHELRQRKPEPEVFMRVARELGCQPSEIIFFDDGEENLVGARQAGMVAYHVEGFEALKRVISQLGLA